MSRLEHKSTPLHFEQNLYHLAEYIYPINPVSLFWRSFVLSQEHGDQKKFDCLDLGE